jgi:hypothetical protein
MIMRICVASCGEIGARNVNRRRKALSKSLPEKNRDLIYSDIMSVNNVPRKGFVERKRVLTATVELQDKSPASGIELPFTLEGKRWLLAD